MSKSFFNYIQPTIVRLSDDPDIPEHLRNHYLVNLNVVGIQYFIKNFLLIEDGHGGYMYMLTNDMHKIRLSENGLEDIIDIPRAYIILTDEFIKSQEDMSSWILSAINDNSFFITGTDKFKPGRDFYINNVLWKYLYDKESEIINGTEDIIHILPDYLNGNFEITKYWKELEPELARYTNFEFFKLKNKIADLTYSEDELDNFAHTFFNILKNDAMISEEDMLKTYNQIYSSVINYYYNGQTDCALAGIALILNTQINTSSNSLSNCGCSGSANSQDSYQTTSCYDSYKEAMSYWLKTMLGDVNFYKDWMYLTSPDDGYAVNEPLIDELILLLEDFLNADYDLSFSGKSIYNHTCGIDPNEESNMIRHNIIKNYITLLNWVRTGCIDNNKNKIKVIGEAFGELLPKMQF